MTRGRVRVLVGACVLIVACGDSGPAPLRTFSDSASYAVGMSMSRSLGPAESAVDIDLVARGLADMTQGQAQLPLQDAQRILQTFGSQVQQQYAEEQAEQAAANLGEGDEYRAANAMRPGVETTPSGLQYEVLTQGDGPVPTASDQVTVHYRGTLIDGTEFDSSLDGDPLTFAVNGVIRGWTEALLLMAVGSKYRIVVPPDIGYGTTGSPPDIGPNATLIFEVELLAIP